MSECPQHVAQTELDAVILKHHQTISNLGVYENISRPMGVNGKGLANLKSFLEDLLQIAPWANLHLTQVREAVLTTNKVKGLNKSSMSDKSWAGQRTERIITILAHLRRLLVPYRFEQCATKMSKASVSTLQALVQLIDTRYVDTGSTSSKRVLTTHLSNTSAVSCDSDGFPLMLQSPQKKAKGQQIEEQEKSAEDAEFFSKLGLKKVAGKAVKTKEAVLKKPACSKKSGYVVCPDFPRKLETPKGTLKLTFASDQSYIHFQDLNGATTFLLMRSRKSSPDHHDDILRLAEKLAKQKHEKGADMKEAALKLKDW